MSEHDADLKFFREELYKVEAEKQRIEGVLKSARDFVEKKAGGQMSSAHVDQLRQLLNSA